MRWGSWIDNEHRGAADDILNVIVNLATRQPRLAGLRRLEIELFFDDARSRIEEIVYAELDKIADYVEGEVRDELEEKEGTTAPTAAAQVADGGRS